MATVFAWMSIAGSVIAVIGGAHAVVFSKCAEWHWGSARLWRSGVSRSYMEERKAEAPWFIRYSAWLDRYILGRKAARQSDKKEG